MDIEVLDCIKDAALIEQYKREVVEEEYEQRVKKEIYFTLQKVARLS